MTKIKFVTSIHEDGIKQYGLTMLETVAQFWDKDLELVVYYHDFDIDDYPVPTRQNIIYKNLNDVQDMVDYRNTFSKYNGNYEQGYNWRMDAIKWCHKVFAMSEEAFLMCEEAVDAGWLLWIDADTATKRPVSQSDIEELLHENVSVVHLGRKDVDYSETSFLGFNLSRENPLQLLADLRGAYMSGEVLGYREWHDGFVFERLLNIYKAHGTNVENLTPKADGLDAFGQSPLSQYFIHYKGNKKSQALSKTKVAPDVVGPQRYKALSTLIDHYKCKSAIEVGTWNGGRAIQMAQAAFKHSDTFTYTGYDLFDDATEESDAREMNSKAHNTVEAVEKRLSDFREAVAKEGKEFKYCLVKGDTNKTLWGYMNQPTADLVYIDGGHSYATTKNDYEALKHNPLIVFDDYFGPDKNGNTVIEEHCGTNQVIEEIQEAFKEAEEKPTIKVLSSDDPVKGGGITHFAVVVNPSLDALPKSLTRVPIVVTPKDCMPSDYIINNINENIKLLEGTDNWVTECGITETHAIVVSGGDFDTVAIRDLLDDFNADQVPYILICVKHAYPRLLQAGVHPDYCLILDPRPIDGVSTHGITRKDLFKEVSPTTEFLVASMTDPSVTQHLLDKAALVSLWHAYSDAIRDPAVTEEIKLHPDCKMDPSVTLVTGGTCAAMRIFGLFHILGFRFFHLFGFDCSIPEEHITDDMKKEVMESGAPKYFKVETNDKVFWTTGELLAMAQDCERLFDRQDIDFKIYFHENGESLVSEVFTTSKKSKEPVYYEVL